jgi:rubrerythrin
VEEVRTLVREARRLEALSMSIYVRLAQTFRGEGELHAFWMSMARHEAAHVGALELLESMLDESGLEIELPTTSMHIEAAARLIESIAARNAPDLSIDEAFDMAIELEGGELEDLVLDLIHSLSDDIQRDQAAMMLVHDLSDLSLMVEKYSRSDELLAKADALVEHHVSRREGKHRLPV